LFHFPAAKTRASLRLFSDFGVAPRKWPANIGVMHWAQINLPLGDGGVVARHTFLSLSIRKGRTFAICHEQAPSPARRDFVFFQDRAEDR